MHSLARRAVVVILALAMTVGLAGTAAAAPRFRPRPLDTRPNPDVVMRGSGWGHGVGMSQYGAYAQAQAGWGHGRILKYYYRGIAVGTTSMPANIRVGLSQTLTFSNVKAVSGSVPWRECSSGCKDVALQPPGTTWKVQLLSDGSWRLMEGSTRKWRGGAGTRLLAAFNARANADGPVIEAYNPNGPRRLYKWGSLEYSAGSVSAGTIVMVLDIPSMELYLRGLGEMPSSWGIKGMAALQAQATAGRTYALRMHLRGNGSYGACRCSLGATPANQVYVGYDKEIEYAGGYWIKAVDSTAGRVATYGGELISTFYSSSHGGRSENVEDSWAYTGASPTPYLRSVDDPWSLQANSGNPNIAWDYPVSNGSFASFVGDISQVRRVKVVGGRTAGGTPKTIRVWGRNSTGASVVIDRTGDNGIVGISLKKAYGGYGLKSQQIRRFGFAPFTDDDSSPHEYAIVYAYDAGIMTDVRLPRFRPGTDVARGRAALYLYRTFDLPAPTKSYYDDISDRPRAERTAINALAEAGISGGLRKRLFRPTNVLTRAQAAVFFRNAIGMSKKNTAYDYFDDDDAIPAEAAINRMARKGLMTGCGARKFCPGRGMKRGAMATLLHRTVEAYR